MNMGMKFTRLLKGENGEHETFAIIGNGEAIKLMYIDGDGFGE